MRKHGVFWVDWCILIDVKICKPLKMMPCEWSLVCLYYCINLFKSWVFSSSFEHLNWINNKSKQWLELFMSIVWWCYLLGIKLIFCIKPQTSVVCLPALCVAGYWDRRQSLHLQLIYPVRILGMSRHAFLKDCSQFYCGKTPADCKVSKGNLWKWLLINGAKITKICSQRPKLPPSSKYLAAVSHAWWLRSAVFYVQDLEITRHEDYSPYHCIATFTQKSKAGKPCNVWRSK